MGPPESTPVESTLNQRPVNNITIATREGSPQYMVASADGTEAFSQRSGKKRRRLIIINYGFIF